MSPVNKYLEPQHAEHPAARGGGGHSPHHQTSKAAAAGRGQALAEASSAIMNKVAILTSSTHEPGVTIRPRSDLIALFGPTFDLAIRFQRLVAIASSFLFLYGHILATSTLTSAVIATRFFVARSTHASKKTLSTLRRSIWTLWESKKTRKIRKKLFMEFATTILGPGGNMMIMMIFWPGWLFVVGLAFAIRMLTG